MVNISVNQKKCIGCDTCIKNAPEMFKIDGKIFKCKVKNNGVLTDSAEMKLSEEQLKMVKKAAKDCPTGSIKIL